MENDTTKRHQTCRNLSAPARSLLPRVPLASHRQCSGAGGVLEGRVDGDHLRFIPAAQSGPRRSRPRTPDCKHITSRKRLACRIWSLLRNMPKLATFARFGFLLVPCDLQEVFILSQDLAFLVYLLSCFEVLS